MRHLLAPAAAFALLALAACGTVTSDVGENPFTSRPVANPDPISTDKSESKVEKAVITAAKLTNWEVIENDMPMQLKRTLDDMTAVIRVRKEGGLVVIQLESSLNMHQHLNQGTQRIHYKYNTWVGELANQIKAELAK